MGGHFYTKNGEPKHKVVNARGTGLRNTTPDDAKALDLYASTTTKGDIIDKGDGFKGWLRSFDLNIAADNSSQLHDLYSKDPKEWKRVVRSIAAEEMRKAPNLGSSIHGVVEYLLGGFDAKIEEATAPYVGPIRQFIEHHGIVADDGYIEKRVISDDMREVGTLDFRGTFGEYKKAYIDWKTQGFKRGKPEFYFTWGLQLASYAYMDGGLDDGTLISVAIDTSGHPYQSEWGDGKVEEVKIVYKVWENNRRLFELHKMASELYYAFHNWEK